MQCQGPSSVTVESGALKFFFDETNFDVTRDDKGDKIVSIRYADIINASKRPL